MYCVCKVDKEKEEEEEQKKKVEEDEESRKVRLEKGNIHSANRHTVVLA